MREIIALLDADLILHRAASSAQAAYEFDGGTAISADFNKARSRAQELIADYRSAVAADRVVLCLSDPSGAYWRKDVLPTYKANRGETAKPVLFRNLRDWAEESFECVWHAGLEGDDVLGILLTHPTKYGPPSDKIAVTVDHDALQVPGRLYRPHRREEGVIDIGPEEAKRAHLMQTLTGDAGDNYFGIRGVGPSKASKILDAAPRRHTTHSEVCACRPWSKVVAAYEKAGLDEGAALQQARVAFILRTGWYHKYIGVKLWEPGE